MSAAKRLWLVVVRHSGHSLCLFLLAFCFALFAMVSTYLSCIVSAYQELLLQDTGYQLLLELGEGGGMSADTLAEIEEVEEVTGINVSNGGSIVFPVSFRNAVEEDEDNPFSFTAAEEVKLFGNSNPNLCVLLQNHTRLLSGCCPDEEHPGVLIDRYLAEANGLALGDTLTVSADGETETSITIVGLYEVTDLFEEEQVTASGNTSYGQAPYSYLFCDLDTCAAVFQTDYSEPSAISIYAENRSALGRVYQRLIRLGYDEEPYTFTNETEQAIDEGSVTTGCISRMSYLTGTISNVCTGVVLFLIVLLWMRNQYHDIAVLISLGQSRISIAAQYFLVTAGITLAALVLALPLCVAGVNTFGEDLLAFSFTLFAGGSSGSDAAIESAMSYSLQWTDYLAGEGRVLVICCLAVLVSSIEILRCKPRILFQTE